MTVQKYSVNQHLVQTLLTWVKTGEIAIPEIQRPFVWESSKIRDLIDSLYRGYPVGYLIAWQNPNVRLKDGSLSVGKKILIDGQQRVTALTAAILGSPIVTKDYRKTRIRIAFHPQDERFEVANPAIEKDATWIHDIAPFFNGSGLFDAVDDYMKRCHGADKRVIQRTLGQLIQLPNRQIGLIDLAADLDIETVTDIFIRINSQGVVLGQADFAMSKIAAAEEYGGPKLRKTIDYFCRLAAVPEDYSQIAEGDKDFAVTDEFRRITWLKNEKDDLYDPTYGDVLRVAFTTTFGRGKLGDLVSLLSGRDFEKRTYEAQIAADTFAKLRVGVARFTNETNFKDLLLVQRSAGFVEPELVRSQNALNFAYIVYLTEHDRGTARAEVQRLVARWLVMSILTSRHSGSFETQFEQDIRSIRERGTAALLADIERGQLSEAFWSVTLPKSLETSVASSPYWGLFVASQVKGGDKGFLSRDVAVSDLVTLKGDVHHIYPRKYLKSLGLGRAKYNQIANYAVMQTETNIQIGAKAPERYFKELVDQVRGGKRRYGSIEAEIELRDNFGAHCIPIDFENGAAFEYEEFLANRRDLMARKIKKYYASL
ncbi:MAG: DUF262 domain-containing protein [Rhodospirillaceae bacterium]|nr:DUF262 domain-containing protein [Rhodospirillaceae bacterium]